MSARLDREALFASVEYRPHDGQRLVHSSAASRRVLACGVRWGKTTLAVHEALAAVLAPAVESRGWIVTPSVATTELVTSPLFAILHQRFGHRVLEYDERARRIVVRNLGGGTSEVCGKSADRPVALLGTALDWVIFDECARLSGDLWSTVISQRLADRRGTALLMSAPRGVENWFYDQFERGIRGDEGYESWTGPTSQNPKIGQEILALEEARLSLHEFQAEYEGRFIGRFGAVCARCGWARDWQPTIVWAPEYDALRPCLECGRPVTATGDPVGSERADGSIRIEVHIGPEEELPWREREELEAATVDSPARLRSELGGSPSDVPGIERAGAGR
jgi:hypothetical protein